MATRVLLVEDHRIIREGLRSLLEERCDAEVIAEAAEGRAAVRLAAELSPDVVIMDIKFEGEEFDGIDAARVLTEERVAPVLLLTAYSQRDLVVRAREAGVVGYLVKPFREADLIPAIEVALARFGEFKAMEQEVGDLKEALETRKFVDRAKGILMDTQGLTEAEAFRKIQKMSMNTRKPMKEVAEAVILAHQTQQQTAL